MGRAGRPTSDSLPPELRELAEEGLPEGWGRYWSGKKKEMNERAVEGPAISSVAFQKKTLDKVSIENDYTDFQTYYNYGIAIETLETYYAPDKDSAVSKEEQEAAVKAVKALGDLDSNPDISLEGLHAAEKMYTEMAYSLEGENEISETMDPDREFLFQDDRDHLLALAHYVRAVRTSALHISPEGNTSYGRGMRDAAQDHFFDAVNQARARQKP